MHAGECKAFIFRAPIRFFLQKAFNSKTRLSPSHRIATILLQWNRKPKMMRPVSNLYSVTFVFQFDRQRRLRSDGEQGFPKMINTLKRAAKLAPLLAAGAFRNRSVCPGAEPGPARRHQVAMPRRLHGALRQRAAGRRGLAAMPAEEHVEPVVGLRRSAVRARRRPSRACCGQGRQKPHRPNSAAPAAAATAAPKAAAPKAAAGSSRPMRRFPRSAPPAAPTIRRSATACRPAAHRRCNAWKRTRRNSRPLAATPSPPPAAVVRQRPRLQRPQLRLRRARRPR